MPRYIDLDSKECIHLLCNLDPKWKPMPGVTKEDYKQLESVIEAFKALPRAEVYTLEDVAQILADACGDYHACNMNGNDEWLPQKCKYAETDCPNTPEPLDCWKEYLLHLKERNL